MTERMNYGRTVALVNNKGGVGKTTSAVNLSAGIAAGKKKVLLADLDAQGSASLSLGLTRADLTPGTGSHPGRTSDPGSNSSDRGAGHPSGVNEAGIR